MQQQPIYRPRAQRTCGLCNDRAVEDEAHMVFHCTHAPLQAVREVFPGLQSVLEEGSVHALLSQPPHLVAAFLYQSFEVGDYTSLPYWGNLDSAAEAGGDV
jgi:hypothetical protein